MLGLKQAGNALNDQTQCVSKLPRGTNVTMTLNGSSVPSFERISYAKAETLYHSRSGPEGYPRVLDYSIFKSLLVPYSKNFTTRSSS